jgi:hypothetical protein
MRADRHAPLGDLPRTTKTRPGRLYKARLVTAAVTLVAGLTGSASVGMSASASSLSSAQAIQAIGVGWSSVPEYSAAPALASGEVVNSAGTPLAQSTIILFPVPLTPETGAPLTPLARTVTDSQGRFTVRLPASQLSKLTTSRSAGALNLQVDRLLPGWNRTPVLLDLQRVRSAAP